MKIKSGLLVTLLASSLAGSAVAADVSAVSGTLLPSFESGFAVSSTDLVNTGQATLGAVSLISGLEEYGSTINELNNGSVFGALTYNNSENSLIPSNGAVVEFSLNTTINQLGYTITSIKSLVSYNLARYNQRYDLSVSVVGSDTFTTITGDGAYTVNRFNTAAVLPEK